MNNTVELGAGKTQLAVRIQSLVVIRVMTALAIFIAGHWLKLSPVVNETWERILLEGDALIGIIS